MSNDETSIFDFIIIRERDIVMQKEESDFSNTNRLIYIICKC